MELTTVILVPIRMKTREKKVENLENENQTLKRNLSSVGVELSNKTKENKKLVDERAATERSHEKVCNRKLDCGNWPVTECDFLYLRWFLVCTLRCNHC